MQTVQGKVTATNASKRNQAAQAGKREDDGLTESPPEDPRALLPRLVELAEHPLASPSSTTAPHFLLTAAPPPRGRSSLSPPSPTRIPETTA